MDTDTLLPQTTETAIFNITGGPIQIHGLTITIGTVVQTQATVTRWIDNPTTGLTVPLCGDLDLTAAESGAIYSVVNLVELLTLGHCMCAPSGICRGPGVIALDTDGSSSGSFTAELWWSPLPIDTFGGSGGGVAVSAI